MNGHWVSGTRKLNHHYQSAVNYKRAYMYLNQQEDFSGVNMDFTPQGLVLYINSSSSTRNFCRVLNAQITDQYLPLAVVSEYELSCAGVRFKTLDLADETFTCEGLDIIMRRETLTFYSKYDNSTFDMECLVFLINTAELTTFTDSSGVIWWSTQGLVARLGHMPRITFPNIDMKLAIVGEKFSILRKDTFYYHSVMNSTNFEVSGGVSTYPKNLNNFKKGTITAYCEYRINKEQWELPNGISEYDTYYGIKVSLRGEAPFESVVPNMVGSNFKGNYIYVPSGVRATFAWHNRQNTRTEQFRAGVPYGYETKFGSWTEELDYTDGTNTQSWSGNGKFLANNETGAASFGSIFSKVEGLDWELDFSDAQRILNGTWVRRTYGEPFLRNAEPGSSMSLSSINDIWINNVGSNA